MASPAVGSGAGTGHSASLACREHATCERRSRPRTSHTGSRRVKCHRDIHWRRSNRVAAAAIKLSCGRTLVVDRRPLPSHLTFGFGMSATRPLEDRLSTPAEGPLKCHPAKRSAPSSTPCSPPLGTWSPTATYTTTSAPTTTATATPPPRERAWSHSSNDADIPSRAGGRHMRQGFASVVRRGVGLVDMRGRRSARCRAAWQARPAVRSARPLGRRAQRAGGRSG